MFGSAARPSARNPVVVTWGLLCTALMAAWMIGGWISTEDMRSLEYTVLFFVVCVIAVTILRSWRNGFYLFLVWLLFEDLARKYMGNNMVVYFGKDFLALMTCLSLLVEIRRGKELAFRPPFLLWLSLFFWLGFLQVFNPNSPSILYGLLGMKLYFYYIPLMFAGYALIRNEEELHRFLMANMGLAGVISSLGIAQAIVGPSFLNPATLAPEIQELSQLTRYAPISHAAVFRPTGVFVSDGRFAWFLIMMWMIGMGTAAYLLMKTRRGRKIAFGALGLIVAATMLSGSRGAVITCVASSIILLSASLWGAPWRWGQVHRLMKAIRRAVIAAAIALGIMVLFFPKDISARWELYSETLSPESPAYELSERVSDYPFRNLAYAFEQDWVFGHGIGTSSLGVQYVSRLLGQRSPSTGIENGYGTLIVEMGILAPFLWTLWTVALMVSGWRVARRLKGSPYFPLAAAILLYFFDLLFVQMYGGVLNYQNYVSNAYLWFLVGVLFRLPQIAAPKSVAQSLVIAPAKHAP
jgi:hypothetical protein